MTENRKEVTKMINPQRATGTTVFFVHIRTKNPQAIVKTGIKQLKSHDHLLPQEVMYVVNHINIHASVNITRSVNIKKLATRSFFAFKQIPPYL